MDTGSIREIVHSLRNSFLRADFDRAVAILEAREEALKASVLELQLKKAAGSSPAASSKELLSAREEAERHKRCCARLEEQVSVLRQGCAAAKDGEARAQRKISEMTVEIDSKDNEMVSKIVEFRKAARDLEDDAKKARDEAAEWKRRYGEVEAYSLRVVDENLQMKKTMKGKQEEEAIGTPYGNKICARSPMPAGPSSEGSSKEDRGQQRLNSAADGGGEGRRRGGELSPSEAHKSRVNKRDAQIVEGGSTSGKFKGTPCPSRHGGEAQAVKGRLAVSAETERDVKGSILGPYVPVSKNQPRNEEKKVARSWGNESELYCSLLEDTELCMKGICAIYRQQKSSNKYRRFVPTDEYNASTMARFLMDGDAQGPLKKSVQELRAHDPKGVDYCCKLATSYSHQLFLIYKNKEDPFFPIS